MIVYVSGKYSDTPKKKEKHIRKAAEMGLKLMALGHSPIIPHTMTRLLEILDPDIPYDRWIDMDLDILNKCDAIFMLDNWQDSQGAKLELKYALEKKKAVFFSLNDVPDCRREEDMD